MSLFALESLRKQVPMRYNQNQNGVQVWQDCSQNFAEFLSSVSWGHIMEDCQPKVNFPM